MISKEFKNGEVVSAKSIVSDAGEQRPYVLIELRLSEPEDAATYVTLLRNDLRKQEALDVLPVKTETEE